MTGGNRGIGRAIAEAFLKNGDHVAVTASALEEHEQRTRAVGMDGLLTKPIGIEQLRATLDVWLKDARMEQAT